MTPAEFDALWANRHEETAASACETFLKNQLATAPDYDWFWRAAWVEYFRGLQASDSGDEAAARARYDAAAAQAAKADEAKRDQVEAPFWRGIATLEAGLSHGKLTAMKAFGPAERFFERTVYLDEAYLRGAALRELGRIYRKRPLILGGVLDRSIAFHKHAREIGPADTTNLLYLADVYITDRQPKLAKETLQALLAIEPEEGWIWEGRRDQRIAREWLVSRFD